ncbi:MAG: SxtJ family membrane protein [Saprospiraceae bacterium]
MKAMKAMNKEQHKETCLVIMTGLLVFWLIYKADVLITIAIAIGVIGAFIPALARWIHWAWYKLADAMGYVMSKVILSIVFFTFLSVIALIYKVFNKDPLQLKKKKDTYWTNRNHTYSGKDIEKVW